MDPSYLRTMSAAEVAEYLARLERPGKPPPARREELASVLEASVVASPSEFLARANAFFDLPMPYREALIRGLRGALEAGRVLDGYSVVRMLSRFFEPSSGISIHLRRHVWTVIDSACDVADPSLRGQAFHNFVRYARWVHWHETKRVGGGGSAFNMDAIPEVRRRLERHLDPEVESSPAVWAVYGQWFPHLCLIDEEWARNNVDAIFPDGFPHLRDAAWEAYLDRGDFCTTSFMLLRRQYRAAVHRLARSRGRAATPRKHSCTRLGEHLLHGVGCGALAWPNAADLLMAYFLNATPDDARTAVVRIGQYLYKNRQFRPETIQRFAHLLDSLLGFLSKSGRDRLAYLSSLGFWIASGRFDAAWALSRLHKLIELVGAAKPTSVVMNYLVQLAGNHPAKCFRVLESWVEAGGPGSHLAVDRYDSVRQILRAALADDSVSDEARALVKCLDAADLRQFSDLLGPCQSHRT